MAILENAEVIGQLYDENGVALQKGTISAGYQNFLICIEMFFAAVALKYAFPVNVRHPTPQIVLLICSLIIFLYSQVYSGNSTDGPGRSVTMQSISSSLKVCKHK